MVRFWGWGNFGVGKHGSHTDGKLSSFISKTAYIVWKGLYQFRTVYISVQCIVHKSQTFCIATITSFKNGLQISLSMALCYTADEAIISSLYTIHHSWHAMHPFSCVIYPYWWTIILY